MWKWRVAKDEEGAGKKKAKNMQKVAAFIFQRDAIFVSFSVDLGSGPERARAGNIFLNTASRRLLVNRPCIQ